MKYNYLPALLLLFSFWSEISNAQTLRLVTRNPIHRENPELEIEYFYTNSDIENRFEAYIENEGAKNLINGTIKINDTTNTSSEINIGPIDINYNGKNIKSDSFKIRVFKKLPDTNYGIWINQVNIEGSEFIVIEQRIPSSMGRKKSASFNLESFLNFNIQPFQFFYQSSSFQAHENIIEKAEYKEFRTILLIRDIENLKKDLIIDDRFFKDLPENYEPIKLIIKKK